jgi:Fur family peroxide stress response transcriptional regulator
MKNQTRDRLDNLATKLRKRGQRLTPQRMAVLKVLASSEEHLSVDQIYEQVKVDFPMTSLATIYKTINTLKEIGEVRELNFSIGCNRYDGFDPSPHPHLVCMICEKITDVKTADLEYLAKEAADQSGYKIVSQRLDFFGFCPDCQANNSDKKTNN